MAKNSKGSGDGTKLIAKNRRARFDYHLEDSYEAGIVLTGTEVKSLRAGKASIVEAWVKIDTHGEAWLMQAHVEEYEFGNRNNHDPTRQRKLLLHRNEILKLQQATREQGTTMVPIRLYFRDGRAKLEFAVARGKQAHDKREDLKRKQAKREMERALRRR